MWKKTSRKSCSSPKCCCWKKNSERNQNIKPDKRKKNDKIYFTSLHLGSFMNADTGCVWSLSRCDHEPNTTVPERQNSHQLQTSWQRTSGQLCVSAGSESFVSILMPTKGGQGDSVCSQCTTHTHTVIYMCLIPDNPSRAGNAINQAAIFAEIRDTKKITRYDRCGVLKVGGSAAAGQIETRYAICTHYSGTNRP